MKFTIVAIIAAALAAASPTANYQRRKTCPANGTLPPNYVKPSMIVNVSKKLPNVPFGKTQKPLITPGDFCAIFNLELPPSATDKICQLVFKFPDNKQTSNPFYYQTGKNGGHFSFTGYAIGAGATAKTTYKQQPAAGPNPPSPPAVLAPGNAYIINSAPCGLPAGLTKPVTVSGMLCSSDTTFNFLNSDATCPIGFFVELLDMN
ncbi:uncharacterized protein CTRU02_215362 [Colletotrichum truncatum]|uniref:Uncharacterized protein n=1 Tax=Colletotrichum truncatum TaxID=5467 RepID=A0ACC3YD01_COLTU|nr:uncharacterized protein CTRU02_13318 [Colletotrichum truncatum]KAF6783555.1 hypothetical protein CTRU02_13318 [Colletotrichum truncatum]